MEFGYIRNSNFIHLFYSRNTIDRRYEVLLSGVENAAKEGLRGLPCSLMYKCDLWA